MCFALKNVQAQFEAKTNETTLFAQGLFTIESKTQMKTIESQIREIPVVSIARLDWNTQRFFILTKDIDHLNESDLRKWFGDIEETLNCIQIGVKGINKIEEYPFTNCQN